MNSVMAKILKKAVKMRVTVTVNRDLVMRNISFYYIYLLICILFENNRDFNVFFDDSKKPMGFRPIGFYKVSHFTPTTPSMALMS